MSHNAKNYLGIDWGAAKIGIALAHSETGVALPYATLKNDADLLRRLEEIISSEDIGTLVIGVPSYVGEKVGPSGGEKLGQSLQRLFPVTVAYQDEIFTTKMAHANLLERGMKMVSKHDDEEAARIILQEWLDKP